MADKQIDHAEQARYLLQRLSAARMPPEDALVYATAAQAYATLALVEATREARNE